MFYYLVFSLLLLVAVFCIIQIIRADLGRRIIPDAYLFPLMLTGLIIIEFFPWISSTADGIVAAAFGYFAGVIIGKIFEKIKKSEKTSTYPPIGMGDIKLLAVGGIWLGMTGLAIAIVVSCVLGGIWGWRNKQKFIPYAPFFFGGAIIALIVSAFLI